MIYCIAINATWISIRQDGEMAPLESVFSFYCEESQDTMVGVQTGELS